MSTNFNHIPHKGIQTLSPYKPGKPIVEVVREFGISDIIKLASNENAQGCSPAVLETLHRLPEDIISYYPSALNHPLYDKLAEKWNISRNQLIIANGSDSIFQFVLMAFALHTERHMLTHEYAFVTYQILSQALGIPFYNVPSGPDWQVDMDALIQQCTDKTGVIFIANPNNPTGKLVASDILLKLLDNIPESTIVVLDEAYYEYAASFYTANSIDWLNRYKNLVITRTFSKAYGLAGLRLGYAMAHPEIIALLHKVQLPFAVNQVALEAGLAALEDTDFLQTTLQTNAQGLQQMLHGLEALKMTVLSAPTGNFVTMDCQQDSTTLYQKLLEQGIITRPLHPYNMPRHLRITIGTAEQNARFLNVLREIL